MVDGLGAPIVAAWTPSDGDQRWYIVPGDTDWNQLLGWLIRQALPEFVPGALYRARSPYLVDPLLQTESETTARNAIEELETNYARERTRLQEELDQATASADPVRYRLLYGTGEQLVDAVETVLTLAGVATVNLDEELSGTRSADLLASLQGERRLIEVKSTSGAASESLVGDLDRHLATWPRLRPHQPVEGGVLIVNHQHKLQPDQRPAQVYTRPEFVESLRSPVISTGMLFDWWRTEDWAAIRAAILGKGAAHTTAASANSPTSQPQRPWSRWRRKPNDH
ncbi:hypothetical protein [Spirillospora sp. CA-294931]|uniref:hypothetical protein n=1 Tax=Spirillospora sp. CA-294931 TaxID=3240042 RepID=UPI003D917944